MNTVMKFAAAACLAIGLPAAALAQGDDQNDDAAMQAETETAISTSDAITLLEEAAAGAADVQGLTDADKVLVVSIEDLKANGQAEQAAQIDDALEAFEDLEGLAAAIAESETATAALEAAGYMAGDVVAAARSEEHGLVLFVLTGTAPSDAEDAEDVMEDAPEEP